MRIFSVEAFESPTNSHIKKRIVTLTKGETDLHLENIEAF